MEGITGIIARRAIQELPDVNLNMVEGLSHTLEEWLDDGRLNLACVFDGSDETTGRPGQVLYEEPFVFVGNADALRPEDGPITLAEALRQPLMEGSRASSPGAIQELPDVNLNMVEGLSHTLEEWLDDGRLNLACVFDGSDETTGRPGQVLYEEPRLRRQCRCAARTVRSRWPRRCASRWWCRRAARCARCWKTRRASSASRSMCASRWNPVRS